MSNIVNAKMMLWMNISKNVVDFLLAIEEEEKKTHFKYSNFTDKFNSECMIPDKQFLSFPDHIQWESKILRIYSTHTFESCIHYHIGKYDAFMVFLFTKERTQCRLNPYIIRIY